MGRLFLNYLSSKYVYICATCGSHLSEKEQIISKEFQGNSGRAYLFNKVVNVCSGVAVKRYLMTGQHKIADIYCKSCQEVLGWTYILAYEEEQKYKEGKFVIEKAKMKRSPTWGLSS